MNEADLEQLTRTYDDWYQAPENAHWEDAPGKAVLVEAIRLTCPASAPLRVLDLGCGTGSFLERLRRQVSAHWQYHGVDLSSVAVEAGRSRYRGLALRAGDATSLEEADGSFDIVTCYGSWEHFPEPAEAIAEAGRLLAPGGWVFAMIPTLGIHRTDTEEEGWYEDTEVAGCSQRQLQWNLRRDSWAKMFEDAGLLLVEGSFAARCGAHKPGVFYFGVKAQQSVEPSTETVRAFLDLGQLAGRLARSTAGAVDAAAAMMGDCLVGGGKILVCGNGGSAADAQHFAAELVGRLRRERRALPSISLATDPSTVTAIANDYGYERVFARQVEALGDEGDVLLGISTSGRSANVLQAFAVARRRGLRTVALIGATISSELEACDHVLSMPAEDAQRVQEAHSAVLHALCAGLEARVLRSDGGGDGGGDLAKEA
jgi:D-sedoheptulose 7-phosphate isomerase